LKKLAAILLIGILFFNWYGFRLLTNYWQQQAARRLETRIHQNNYDESNLIAIKFPIAGRLPYANSPAEWQAVDGEVIISDIAYKYVKRRIVKDSLELLCLRNTESMELGKAGNEFFGKVNDFPGSKPSPQKDFQKLFSLGDDTPRLITPDPIEAPRSNPRTPATLIGHSRRTDRPPILS
jgi:hypothetical protein